MACNDEVTVLERQAPLGVDASQAAVRGDETNLYAQIDRDGVFGINLANPDAAATCIKPWDQRGDMSMYTESGVDDQLIITIPFIAPVRIKTILVNVGRGDFAPQRIRAFVNRPNGVSFDELEASAYAGDSLGEANARAGPSAQRSAVGPVSSGKPQADFTLLPDAVGVTEYPVSISRFSNTNSVTLVLSDAPSRNLSRVYYLGFRGTSLQLKKEAGERFDVPAANAADRPIVDGVRDKTARANYAR